ncbi:metal dependent phosphohydrolase [Syntrophobotulus glycolicus DSM 8271]|uniref:Metal dependent phosphohydrolase n=1 Tax=Syntrophobotulus glycolicus (strain DSM 8271 / FlGlyR) TaxID=645991 RepID=F0SYH5_SYNGF|nr:HD-GYP domain-containing protein [Syntrophobotulus glycolicus]ADY57087.1 metal dependent phosphohydrolase [Syntrophobotulus glycolicus DSM 8271]
MAGVKYILLTRHALGEKIAHDIYNDQGAKIIPQHTVINKCILKRLAEFDIQRIPIYDHAEKEDGKTVRDEHSLALIKQSYVHNVREIKLLLNDIAKGKTTDKSKIDEVSMMIYSKINRFGSILSSLNQLRDVDEYTYTHSLNVAIYSLLLAKWLKLGDSQAKDIVEAGILHDLGKCKISPDLLNKRGRLLNEEFELVKKHTTIGFDLSKAIPGIKDEVRRAILLHHERANGNGYPFGVSGQKINIYSKIIAVADVYDALTSERAYKKKKTPFETFKEFEKIGFEQFDPKVMLTFMTNIYNYYLGVKVRLNTGQIAEVIYINPYNPSRPTIKLDDQILDLAGYEHYDIEEMI